MFKLMWIKNGTEVMRVPSQKVMTWQPSPSRAKLHNLVTLSKPPQAHMPHGKGKQKEGKIKSFLLSQLCH
jgi:hypothetical protein